MWLSANIILQKSFITHGAHVDKTFFLLALFWLMTAAGQAWTRRGRRHAGGRRTENLTGMPLLSSGAARDATWCPERQPSNCRSR